MTPLTLSGYFEIAIAVIYSIGGPAVIIIGLSTFLGNYFSKTKLEKLNNKHKLELERVKSQLERERSQFFRYSEKQFDLYNSLWLVLNRTRDLADSLWENATSAKLPSFSEQIKQTRQAVTDNMLLIEESHYNDLDKLLKEFEEFQFGKQKLIDIRASEEGSPPMVLVTDDQVRSTISRDRNVRKRYTNLIMKIGRALRKQIKG